MSDRDRPANEEGLWPASALVSSFFGALPDGASHQGEGDPIFALALDAAASSARSACPAVDLDRALLGSYWGARVRLGETPTEALAALHTESLYLALACLVGDERALRLFETKHAGSIRAALRGLDKSGALVDDAMQTMRARLFVSEPSRPGKIAAYLGRGDLGRWLRAVAVRIGLDLLRQTKAKGEQFEDQAVLAAFPDAGDDPGLAHLQKHYGAEVKASFEQVLAALGGKDRTVLRYHYVDGLTIDEIGSIYRVHRTTAFRWLESARKALVSRTRAVLRERVGVRADELDSLMRVVQSQLNLSIRRLLKKSPTKTSKETSKETSEQAQKQAPGDESKNND